MQDRQPGAPGQYKSTLTSAEFQKMQAGEEFTITMVRDDQPIVEGTPYNKASVLPDDLAAIICPDVLNPNPADALQALLPRNGGVPMTADLPMDGHRVINVGEPQESGDAANRGYVDGAVKTARAVNLLDNSDFRNPVAQAGRNGLHGTRKYVCDRWISWNADAIFGDGYMTTGSPYDQLIDPAVIDTSATYTAAIGLADGTVIAYSGNFGSGFGYKNSGIYGGVSTSDGVTPFVRIASGQDVCWAALYEGEYTAETLPEYQPKGYAAEMMECMRYYQYFNHSILLPANEEILPGFRFAVEMRAVPTVTLKDKNDTEGCIELWTSAGLTQGNKVKQIVAASYGIRYMALETAPAVNARATYEVVACSDL